MIDLEAKQIFNFYLIIQINDDPYQELPKCRLFLGLTLSNWKLSNMSYWCPQMSGTFGYIRLRLNWGESVWARRQYNEIEILDQKVHQGNIKGKGQHEDHKENIKDGGKHKVPKENIKEKRQYQSLEFQENKESSGL